jgi:isopentenyl-diphosphate Delta-isomerase
MSDRKKDHIELAFSSQLNKGLADGRFIYEPLLGSHAGDGFKPFTFLGKTLKTPMWVSSMTGGTALAHTINTNLARACREFGMGMGLGSCRTLLESDEHFADFDMRDVIGEDLPLYANIGIVQLENMLMDNSYPDLVELVGSLRADGLIIHVNPIQEWLQREGDILNKLPIETIEEFLSLTSMKVIVKEVGQGMGPESIARLMKLPIEALELAAFGGTNFAMVELARTSTLQHEVYGPLALVGHTADEMLDVVNDIVSTNKPHQCKQIIISGGIRSFLDGYYYISKSLLPSVFGQASNFLRFARGDYNDLSLFVSDQIKGLKFAQAFLKPKTGS